MEKNVFYKLSKNKILKSVINIFLKTLRTLLKDYVFTMNSGLAKGLKIRFGKGMMPKEKLDKNEEFISKLDLKNKIIYDLGAYVGIYTLFFSKTAKKVVSFEPEPSNFKELEFNVKVNKIKNVKLVNAGIGEKNSVLTFNFNPLYPTRSTFKNIADKNGFEKTTCKIFSLDDFIKKEKTPKPDFIKIDIEGFEFNALKGMKKLISAKKPELFIELHDSAVTKKLIDFLLSKKYQIYNIDLEKEIKSSKNKLSEGHIYCKVK